MAEPDRKDSESSSDPRIAATSKISGSMVAALAICIPLVAILRSPVVVFAVIGGAGIAIAAVWLSSRSKESVTKSKQIAALESTIEDLKERLECVEVINHYEKTLAERELAGEEAGVPDRRSDDPLVGPGAGA